MVKTRITPILSRFPMLLVMRGTMTIALLVFAARGRWYYIRWRRRLLPSIPGRSISGGFHWLRLPKCPFYIGEGVLCYPPLDWHSLECHYYWWGTRGARGPKPLFPGKAKGDGIGVATDTIVDFTRQDQLIGLPQRVSLAQTGHLILRGCKTLCLRGFTCQVTARASLNLGLLWWHVILRVSSWTSESRLSPSGRCFTRATRRHSLSQVSSLLYARG